MKTRLARCGAIAAALLGLPSLRFAQIQITPVVSERSNPVFTGDGTNRQFILEQTGTIRVLQPGGGMEPSISRSRQRPERMGEMVPSR